MKKQLKRTVQCDKCPWKLSTNPNDIPNGYSLEKHKDLANTIADADDPFGQLKNNELRIMSCHEEDEAHCIGWLHNQLGIGNNICLRVEMLDYDNVNQIKVVGDQHLRFEDTLPEENT